VGAVAPKTYKQTNKCLQTEKLQKATSIGLYVCELYIRSVVLEWLFDNTFVEQSDCNREIIIYFQIKKTWVLFESLTQRLFSF